MIRQHSLHKLGPESECSLSQIADTTSPQTMEVRSRLPNKCVCVLHPTPSFEKRFPTSQVKIFDLCLPLVFPIVSNLSTKREFMMRTTSWSAFPFALSSFQAFWTCKTRNKTLFCLFMIIAEKSKIRQEEMHKFHLQIKLNKKVKVVFRYTRQCFDINCRSDQKLSYVMMFLGQRINPSEEE